MIPEVREKYNSAFTQQKFQNFLNDIWQYTSGEIDFRICETPLFIDDDLNKKLIEAANEIISSICSKEFRENSHLGLPDKYRVSNESENPLFLQIDFGITKNQSGEFIPKLIELQGFASLYMYQAFLSKMYLKHFEIGNEFTSFYSGFNYNSYEDYFRKIILGDSDPENVILLEIDPLIQKTRIDFYLTVENTGLSIVDIRDIVVKKNKLYYKKGGREIPVDRIYNRVIFDELERKNIEINFDMNADLDVIWLGHPNWFFKISKHSLPMIKSKYAPNCFYLDQLNHYPDNLENYVLKPLYSFAGSGVEVDVSKEMLINIKDRQNYILQEKVEYAPLISTPEGYSKAEIRLMYLWDKKPLLVNNLLRTGRGKMMGVDYNKGFNWIGASIGLSHYKS